MNYSFSNRSPHTLLSRIISFTLGFTLLLIVSVISAKEASLVDITFEVTLENAAIVDANEKVYLVGSHKALGSWHPKKVPLKKVADNKWQTTVKLPEDLLIEYKFTLGDWQRQAAQSQNTPYQNFSTNVVSGKVQNHRIAAWTTEVINTFKGQVTGTTEIHKNFSDDFVKTRDLIVWLPPGYEENTKEHYPVLYMHDGQNVFDPETANYGVDWQVDETATELITTKQVKPFIVVAINNSQDRSIEYYPRSELGEHYMSFVVNKVKPFIDRTYRTKPQREHTAIAGSSMGGIISFGILWQHSDVFSKAICISPALKIENYDYVSFVETHPMPTRPFKVYIDNGGVGLEKRLQPGINEMLTLLEKKGLESQKEVYWFLDLPAQHNEAAWAKRMPQAIKFIFAETSQ